MKVVLAGVTVWGFALGYGMRSWLGAFWERNRLREENYRLREEIRERLGRSGTVAA